jgi:hypothetical protein
MIRYQRFISIMVILMSNQQINSTIGRFSPMQNNTIFRQGDKQLPEIKKGLQIILQALRSVWQGYLDSNQEMTASEAVALPFGDTPIK